jgi:hypothetical protein
MIGLSSYLVSRVMVANLVNVNYYERYVNLVYSCLVPRLNGEPCIRDLRLSVRRVLEAS